MGEAIDSPGALKGKPGPDSEPNAVIIDNQTELPDEAVRQAVMTQWVETAAMQFGTPTSFQLYATNQGSNLLTRSPFRVPTNVMEEIKLARQVADTDDDVRAAIGAAIAAAFADGMENQHEDESTMRLFNRVARDMNLDNRFKEMYREYLISAQCNTVSLYTRSRLNFMPSGTDTRVNAQLSTPLIGVLPAEDIRVISNDMFGNGELAYLPPTQALRNWLEEFFATTTSPARKNQLRVEQPILASLFIRREEVDWNDDDLFAASQILYVFNPRMVHRTTMPKGAVAYPRPRMTANFALLEAKRLLNIMDYSLLQGGTNYIVVAKQGSDKLPAQQPEIDNLTEQVRHASRTGVLVGDHRVQIDIITPDLKELLNPAKRQLIGRKLGMAILNIPEQVTDDPGSEGAKQELEMTGKTITSDRHDLKRHVERNIYDEIAKRNSSAFPKGPPSIWFPKIVLAGVKDFYESVVKARDRGDIPRKYAVEILGYDYEAGVAQRKREKENGDDDVMTPGSVPFSGAPGDGGQGRPPGSSPNNGRGGDGAPPDPAQRQRQAVPQPQVRRPRGEPVKAFWDKERAQTVRVGELTAAVLEEYPQRQLGRVTDFERQAVEQAELQQSGPVAVVPVNVDYEVTEIRAFRLEDGLAMIVGQRPDGALVARALCFREPHFDPTAATDIAMRWGFITEVTREEEAALERPERQPSVMETIATLAQQPEVVAAVQGVLKEVLGSLSPNVTVVLPSEGETEFIRDPETGAIVGKRPKLPPAPEE